MSTDYSSVPPPPQPAGASTRATLSLILGIVGVLATLGGCCCCPALLLGLCAPVAAFLGFQERKDIEAGRAPAAGQGLATAGMILGLVGSAFFAVAVILHIVQILRFGMHGLWGMKRPSW